MDNLLTKRHNSVEIDNVVKRQRMELSNLEILARLPNIGPFRACQQYFKCQNCLHVATAKTLGYCENHFCERYRNGVQKIPTGIEVRSFFMQRSCHKNCNKIMDEIFKGCYGDYIFSLLGKFNLSFKEQIVQLNNLWESVGNLIDKTEFQQSFTSRCIEMLQHSDTYDMQAAFTAANTYWRLEIMSFVTKLLSKVLDP